MRSLSGEYCGNVVALVAMVCFLADRSSAQSVTHVAGTTLKVSQLTGELDLERAEPTISRTSSRFGVRGTDLGASFEHDGRVYFLFGDTWEGRAITTVFGVPSLIRDTLGIGGNLEVVTPLATGGLSRVWRDNGTPGYPWLGPVVFGQNAGVVDAVALIQSTFGSPGNLEVVARAGDKLIFLWNDVAAQTWNGPFPIKVNDQAVTGISGNPALVQRKAPQGSVGNFEVVVPLLTGGIAHYWRDNSAPGFPWHGPVVFGEGAGQIDAVTLIESNFGSPRNLEVAARAGDRMLFLWFDSSAGVWNGPSPLVADNVAITGVSGNPSLIQGNVGVQGNFELIVPLAAGGLAELWRDNDAPDLPWHGPIRLAERAGRIDAVSLIQSNLPVDGSLDVVARSGDLLMHFLREGLAWHEALNPISIQVDSSNGFRSRDSDSIASTSDTSPDDGLSLDFVTAADGVYLSPQVFDSKRGVFESLTGLEVPTGGFSANGGMYVFFTTDHYVEGGDVFMGRSLLAFTADPRKVFRKVYDVSSRIEEGAGGFKLINVVPWVVDNASVPGLPETVGQGVLLWGSGKYRASNAFLAYVRLSSVESHASWRYFAGTEVGTGRPVWKTHEADAVALFNHPCIGELSVAWNPFIRKWLMLYNCGSPRGIVFRAADLPWGPWSAPQLLFEPRSDNGYCHFMHVSWDEQNCDSDFDDMFGVSREREYGGEYGPYMIPSYATGDSVTTTIYFVLSTWNPYQTMLMKSTLHTGVPVRRRLPGDGNLDDRLDISDAVFLLGHLFLGTPARLPCGDGTAAHSANRRLLDSNGDANVDISDAVYTLSFLFAGGPAPVLGTQKVDMPDCP